MAQFTWLGERTLESSERINEVEHVAHEALAGINAQNERLIEMGREIAAASAALSSAVAAGDEQLRANASETREGLSAAVAAVAAVDTRLARALDGGNSHSLERRIVAEISALALLNATADVPHLPPFDSWAMSPLTVRLMRSFACKLGPESTIVELGSGVSTVWIAYALSQRTSPPRYVAIDHSELFAAKTQMHLEDTGVSAAADVVLAPLRAVEIDGKPFDWYATDWIAGVSNIALLVVDGPPAGKDPGARYPALPLLVDRLADNATIIVDDIDRPGESDMLAKWLTVPGVTMAGPVGRSAILNYARPGKATE
ncbi:class I SAM-dependent methyltransferase [Microbacterium sp. UFMG61]|uniref:class I SAM-dependent methyltransferase n=1 Tax=Microbacterium sp. UFMG61 TaxID=2745935 RepID=UPI00188EFE6C|nr:class I SAM-dependent methyltransferase [Microbacterium sp. UFMG61]